MAASSQMMVVPTGVTPGGMFNVQTPSGQMMSVTCPPDAAEGQQIQISVLAPSADPGAVVAKLGNGFVLGKISDPTSAPGDGEKFAMGMMSASGMMLKQDLNDLEGNKIAEILYQSTNIQKYQHSARVVANDGTTLFTFDRPKVSKEDKNPAYPIMLHGTAPYATATSVLSTGGMDTMQVQLTRLDGSGGLRIGKRISKQGYFLCVAFALWVPTVMIGSCFMFYLMHITPVILGLESVDGTTQFTPMLELKGLQTVAFQSAAIPLKLAKHVKKYVEQKSPQPLDLSLIHI